LLGTAPVIAGAGLTTPIAYRWKTQINENAQVPAFAGELPELDHNEIVGWEGPYQDAAAFVLLRDSDDSARYTQNFDALLALLSKKGYTVSNVELSGSTPIQKVFHSYILALWTSLSAAQALGVDPVVTELLDEFKAQKAHH